MGHIKRKDMKKNRKRVVNAARTSGKKLISKSVNLQLQESHACFTMLMTSLFHANLEHSQPPNAWMYTVSGLYITFSLAYHIQRCCLCFHVAESGKSYSDSWMDEYSPVHDAFGDAGKWVHCVTLLLITDVCVCVMMHTMPPPCSPLSVGRC